MMQHGEYRQEPEGKNASYSVSHLNENFRRDGHFRPKIGILLVVQGPKKSFLYLHMILMQRKIPFFNKSH